MHPPTSPPQLLTLHCQRCNHRFTTPTMRQLCRPCSRLDQANRILGVVAHYYQRTAPELLGRSQRQPLLAQRQVAIVLVRQLTQLGVHEIADLFHRSTSTIWHAERALAQPTEALAHDIAQLTQRLKGQ